MSSTEDRTDYVERLVGLRLDGRLDAARERELDELLAGSEDAREIERSLLDLREAMRAEPTPAVPAGLEQRVLRRVGQARSTARSGGEVIVLIRRLSLAAVVILAASLFALSLKTEQTVVSAGNDQPTIEDELQAGTDADGSIHDFLRDRILGRRP